MKQRNSFVNNILMLFSFRDPEDSDDDFAFTKTASRENLEKTGQELKGSMSLQGLTRFHN